MLGLGGDLYCYMSDLHEINYDKDYRIIDCSDNNISNLILKDNLQSLYCYNNNIKELNLNNNLINLSCDIFVDVNNINSNKLFIFFR